MTLYCSLCNHKFQSLIVLPEKAAQVLSIQTVEHIQKHHKEDYIRYNQLMAKLMASLTWNVFMESCIVIPEDETFLLDKLEESELMILRAIGFYEDEKENKDGDSKDQEEGDTVASGESPSTVD